MITGSYEEFQKRIFLLTQIDLSAYKERQMRRRIDSLIDRNGVSSYSAYVDKISKDKECFDEFVNYLTINVSEFYRNPEQWELLEKTILPLVLKQNKSPKIWSAACSTGDEPYSLVMLLSRFMPLCGIKILATDIDKQVLLKAKTGIYNVKSLKGLPEEFERRYFTRINDQSMQIKEEIKRCVEFKQHNLLKDEYPRQCDLIVCRNVVIYFTEEAKTEVYKKFNQSLCTNGILFVGSTEQIIQPVSLGYESMKSFFYRKRN